MEAAPPDMIVGVGASAGGLGAFEAFLQGIPRDGGFGYVLVQHLDPNHESELPSLLQSTTQLVVKTVEDEMPVHANCIYVIPSGKTLYIEHGILRLRAPDEVRGRRMPIDLFLRSLAADQKAKSACVILSGTGSDGSLGLKAIKEAGGVCLVQDPSEAEYDGMPRAAMATGLVDITATARECGAKLAAFIDADRVLEVPESEERPAAQDTEEDQYLARIFDLLESQGGHDFSPYKTTTIWRRIRHRMQIRQIDSLAEYARALETDAKEGHALVRDFLISVTNFFRDREAFEVLERSVIPQLFTDKQGSDTVRVWVPGCATGEEAYSLLMLLREYVRRQRRMDATQLQIFATDIDERALATARAGFYPDSITTDVSTERLKQFFVQEKGGFRIRSELKEQVLFSVHNLLNDPPFSRLDLVSCRNLLIYLKRDVQERVMKLFHYALNDEGYLFLGRSETPASLKQLFETIDKPSHIYRARDVERAYPYPLREGAPPGTRQLKLKARRPDPPSIRVLHRNAVMERYLPPTLLVDEELEIVHVLGDVEDYLRFGSGTPSHRVLDVVRPALRTELRAALFSAFKQDERTELRHLTLATKAEPKVVNIIVEPLEHEQTQVQHALVTFTDREPIAPAEIETLDPSDTADLVQRRLEEELESTRRRLQVITEEYETSNEELLASNEELQSMNEELRSTMEELETSKEELQSTNEELITVNQELRSKVETLNKMNSDIKNLMEATEIATLFLATDLTVQRFTPRATDLFNVIPSDQGRPFAHLSHSLAYERFTEDAEQVLENLIPIEREIQDQDGNWYQMRILPYRTVDNRIDGVIFTFVDVTDLKEAEQRVEKSKRELEKRVEERTAALTRANEALQTEVSERQRAEAHFQRLFRLGPVAGIITALDTGEILDVNDRCLEMVGYERDEVIGRTTLELGLVSNEQRDAERAALTETGQFRDREIQLIAKDGGVIDVVASSEVIDRGEIPSVLTSGIDITARKETEAMLRAAKEEAERMNRLKTSFIANMSHEIRTPLTGIIGFADVLSETLSEENQEFVSFIQTSGKRLLETLNSVLDLARLEAQEIQPQRSPVDLAALAKETASLFELQAKKKGLTFQVDAPDVPLWAELDEGCMKRVLNNLLSNAIKFTEDGRVTLRLSVDTDRPLPVCFHVEDTGTGMSTSFQNELFNDFTQESLGNKRAHEGAGLGLAITKRLIDLMEGTIEVESTKGSGTTFTVRLPLHPVDLVAPTAPEVDDRAPIPSWAEDEAPPRVLVIDDRPEVGVIVERFLSDCIVTAVEDPSTVQRILEDDPAFDVAFVDIQLGADASGEEILAMIRSMPALETLPVVALTAYSLPRDKQRFMDQGFNGYISKPFARRRLRTVLRRMIESGPSAPAVSGAGDDEAAGAPPASVD